MSPCTPAQLRGWIEEELPGIVQLRRDLHAHPEIALEERRTSAEVQRHLSEAGIEFVAGLAGGTGVLGHLPGSSARATGLRADMDALPIHEATGVPYASRFPGRMHACGHDGHTAILVGAARVLARLARMQTLPRPVTFLFQPAEETLGGADRMIRDGCLTGRIGAPVERVFGLHGWPWLPRGCVGVRNGPVLAASDALRIRVTGRGGHAALPHMATDSVVAAAAIVGALQTIASRCVDPLDPVVVSLCMIHGGSVFNVIPDCVEIEGTVRTLSAQTREQVNARVRSIAGTVAAAHGCTAEVTFAEGCPPTVNDPAATDSVRAAARAVDGAVLHEVAAPCMGGEDFAWYCHAVPSSFFLIGLHPPGGAPLPALHNSAFDFPDDALPLGIAMMCSLALQ